MRVLVTGGCGFLGSNIAASYLEQGDEVIVVDSLFREGGASNLRWLQSKSIDKRLQFIQVDIADCESVMNIFRRYAPFDYICHVAGQVAMTTSLADPARDLQTNVIGTFNILEATRLLSPESLISYSSTNKVYGDLERLRVNEEATRYVLPDYINGINEQMPLDFSTPYGCSKGAADQYVRDWSRVYGLKTVVFRHSSIFGGRQYASFDQGWIGWFCKKALEQKRAISTGEVSEYTICGSGKQVRDVLHADDLVRLYRLAYEKADRVSGKIFNIGGGADNSMSLLELFSFLESEIGINSLQFKRLPRRKSDQDVFIADLTSIRHEIGWEPRIDKYTGIRLALQWLQSGEGD